MRGDVLVVTASAVPPLSAARAGRRSHRAPSSADARATVLRVRHIWDSSAPPRTRERSARIPSLALTRIALRLIHPTISLQLRERLPHPDQAHAAAVGLDDDSAASSRAAPRARSAIVFFPDAGTLFSVDASYQPLSAHARFTTAPRRRSSRHEPHVRTVTPRSRADHLRRRLRHHDHDADAARAPYRPTPHRVPTVAGAIVFTPSSPRARHPSAAPRALNVQVGSRPSFLDSQVRTPSAARAAAPPERRAVLAERHDLRASSYWEPLAVVARSSDRGRAGRPARRRREPSAGRSERGAGCRPSRRSAGACSPRRLRAARALEVRRERRPRRAFDLRAQRPKRSVEASYPRSICSMLWIRSGPSRRTAASEERHAGTESGCAAPRVEP